MWTDIVLTGKTPLNKH